MSSMICVLLNGCRVSTLKYQVQFVDTNTDVTSVLSTNLVTKYYNPRITLSRHSIPL